MKNDQQKTVVTRTKLRYVFVFFFFFSIFIQTFSLPSLSSQVLKGHWTLFFFLKLPLNVASHDTKIGCIQFL